MKVKKATKRLSRVEALLSGVLNGYASDLTDVREPLEAATAAVKRALSAIDSNQSSSNQQAASTSGRTVSRPNRRTAEGGEITPLAANKRVTSAKRKGTATASGASRLKGTAEANKRRTARQRAARNAPTTAAQRRSSTRKETTPAGGGTAKDVPENGGTTQTPTSVSTSA
ncbi:MAG: hypothetical protein ACR2JB_00570 [Bryobacteraceae bacterium]